jgi:hypothetical protein
MEEMCRTGIAEYDRERAMNLRSYYPDFVAVDDKGTRWLLESKGAETGEVVDCTKCAVPNRLGYQFHLERFAGVHAGERRMEDAVHSFLLVNGLLYLSK